MSRRLWSRLQRGEDSSYEFTMAIVPIIAVILMIAFATLVRASQMPIWMAATECARSATATRSESVGREQGEQAAIDSLRGNSIQITAVTVEITGDWTPDSPVTCRVSYNIDTSGVAGFAELTGGRVPMSAEVTLRMEPYKSKWN